MQHTSELAYWKLNGYTSQDVDQTFEKMDNTAALKLEFSGGKCSISVNKNALAFTHILERIVPFVHGVCVLDPQLRGSLLFCLEDTVVEAFAKQVPTLCFGKTKQETYSFLVPDHDYIFYDCYKAQFAELDKLTELLPWGKKTSAAFWRGRSTGYKLDEDNWRENLRVRLCLISGQIKDSGLLDAYFSELVQCREENQQRIFDAGIVKEKIPFQEFIAYKYLIEIDGNGCAWRSFMQKMYSNCVTLKVESDNIQWFYWRVLPWVHYIPVRSDLSDLLEKIHWARVHDEECQQISGQATELMKEVTAEDPVRYTARLIGKILPLMRS
jgi:hypothetical protein